MTQAAQQIYRFRGAWASGAAYDENDISITGRWSWRALCPHVAGQQSQPAHGEHWTRFWAPIDGFGAMIVSQALQLPPAPPLVSPVVVQFPAAFAAHPVPAPVSGSLAAAPLLATQDPPLQQSAPGPISGPISGPVPNLPALVASGIPNDSDIPFDNVAMCLSWLKAMVDKTASRDWVDDQVDAVERLLESAVRRIESALIAAPLDTPVRAEVWRRKGLVLGLSSRVDVFSQEQKMLRQTVRLLRKRDRGEGLTAQEAAMATILDELDQAMEAIDMAAEAIEHDPPDDVTADAHWPRLGVAP